MKYYNKDRIANIVDWFIRSEYMDSRRFGENDDWIHDPERMQRCYDAAENGSDGSTHQEIINDWRKSFRDYIRFDRYSPNGHRHESCELLLDAMEDYWNELEEYHLQAGTLFLAAA